MFIQFTKKPICLKVSYLKYVLFRRTKHEVKGKSFPTQVVEKRCKKNIVNGERCNKVGAKMGRQPWRTKT